MFGLILISICHEEFNNSPIDLNEENTDKMSKSYINHLGHVRRFAAKVRDLLLKISNPIAGPLYAYILGRVPGYTRAVARAPPPRAARALHARTHRQQ